MPYNKPQCPHLNLTHLLSLITGKLKTVPLKESNVERKREGEKGGGTTKCISSVKEEKLHCVSMYLNVARAVVHKVLGLSGSLGVHLVHVKLGLDCREATRQRACVIWLQPKQGKQVIFPSPIAF